MLLLLVVACVCCYGRNLSVVPGVTIDDEFTSGDGVTSSGYISGGDDDADDVIYIEEPRVDGKDRDAVQPVVEVYSSAPDQKQFELVPTSTRHQLPIKSRTTGQEFRDGTSSVVTSTTVATSDHVEPVQVKSIDEEDQRSSSPNYVALMVNVGLLAGIVFVVAVFLAVLVSFVLHRRRQRRHRDVTPTTPHDRPYGVPRPTTKPTHPKHVPVHLLVDRQRMFVNVSKVGDPKEWFV